MLPNLLSINFLVPFVAHKFDASKAIRGLRGMPRSVLLIGQANPPIGVDIKKRQRVTSEAEAIGLLGEGSMLLAMWRAAKANADLGMPIDLVILADDATALAATGKVVVQVDAQHAAGELPLYIGGNRIRVGLAVNDTAATAATKLINAINATPSLPVTAAAGAAAGEIALTCRWKGATGNSIDLRSTYYADDRLPQGITVTITSMAGGAVNPDITPVISAIKGFRATEYAMPYTDSANMGVLEAELERRWNFDNMQDGQAVTVMRGTEGEVVGWLGPRNSPQVHTICVTRDLTNPWETAAAAAAAIESHAAIDPAVPFTGVKLNGYVAARLEDDWAIEQRNNMLVAGGSVLETMEDGTANILRMVTNYVTHPTGAPDPSWRNLNWVKTNSYYRWFTVTEFQTKYRGYKLAEYVTEPIPGQKIMTVPLGTDIMLNNYEQFMTAGLFQNMDHYKKTLLVEVDGPNGKLKVVDQPVLITQHYQTEITSEFIAGHV
ncbi:phage tail sheath family protein [Burkholderia thailandensis 34]|uniref:tail sheath protein n=1 Tax=Burkholderia thailandensis TaxID=57975 RepID=UPI0005D7BF8B|nr:tail sheath protein [Burkholderia thailandensis]AJY32742.1 phage tail sheath family protein [Burkholderia thailandensis 34]AOJ60326.1 phage tail protein [Burkholderia thailandensis]KXF57317.1 phage tail protein [Burkholderia thailandensis]PNE77948.1 phage tail protein [Burkholderia thailandensis]